MHTVTFDADRGSAVAPNRVLDGMAIIKTAYTAENGFIFKGWHLNDQTYNFAIPFTLKGGTAINLLFFNLPRLSVDIDLDFCQNLSREEMLSQIEIYASKTVALMTRAAARDLYDLNYMIRYGLFDEIHSNLLLSGKASVKQIVKEVSARWQPPDSGR
ncbi:MAG: nucleotidyl transferase AbiEii/AbiGii toxin family protein [Parabacteroides sp.]|nr:nucleotidyl transferase AbiEii/AbiGii toxin family protein [Parabacteroides sp.]